MKQMKTGEWIHGACAFWVDGVSFNEEVSVGVDGGEGTRKRCNCPRLPHLTTVLCLLLRCLSSQVKQCFCYSDLSKPPKN